VVASAKRRSATSTTHQFQLLGAELKENPARPDFAHANFARAGLTKIVTAPFELVSYFFGALLHPLRPMGCPRSEHVDRRHAEQCERNAGAHRRFPVESRNAIENWSVASATARLGGIAIEMGLKAQQFRACDSAEIAKRSLGVVS
jgi:hypothetical protein